MVHKTCPKCLREQSINAFSKSKGRKDGRNPYCKLCVKAYYEANKHHIKARTKNYALTHASDVKIKQAEYYLLHRNEKLHYEKVYRRDNSETMKISRQRRWREKSLEQKQIIAEKQHKYYLDNRERIAIQQKKYQQKNLERLRAYKAQWVKDNPEKMDASKNRRRTREAQASFVEPISLDVLYARDHGICQLCHKPCKRAEASKDHVIPLVEGGEHSYRNCVLAHRRCNSKKGHRHGIPQQQRLFG